MIDTVPDILARIVAKKRQELLRDSAAPVDRWELEADRLILARRGFRASLLAHAPAIIAEVKKASPSKGILANDFDPVQIAAAYEQGGAAAVSVLTDEAFFQVVWATSKKLAPRYFASRIAQGFYNRQGPDRAKPPRMEPIPILLIAAILSETEIRDFREAAAQYTKWPLWSRYTTGVSLISPLPPAAKSSA